MAKRTATDEKPFRPLEHSLVRSVLQGGGGEVPLDAASVAPEQSAPQPVRQDQPERAGMKPKTLSEASTPPLQVLDGNTRRPADALARRLERERSVLLTTAEDREISRLVVDMGAELGTPLKASHVLRSCIQLLVHARAEILESARNHGRLPRPANGNNPGLERFEQTIGSLIATGIRSAPPPR